MVNSKKMSKSTIAVILLSLLLCLSLVLTATGAWFTDKDSSGDEIYTFGAIDIELAGEEGEKLALTGGTAVLADIMPGDTISGSVVINNLAEAAYLRITVTATNGVDDAQALVLTNVVGATVGETDTDSYFASIGTASDENTNDTITFSFDVELDADVYGNSYQNGELTFSVLVEAIQQANNEDTAEAAFANYTESGIVPEPTPEP